MSEHLTEGEIIERLEAGLRHMTRRRRRVFLAIRVDDLSYRHIAEREGLGVDEVERELAAALRVICDALDGRLPEPWWRRVWRRLMRG